MPSYESKKLSKRGGQYYMTERNSREVVIGEMDISNPLVVKAVSLDNHNGNPVLSLADANRVLIENGATGFLDNASVVFLR